MSIKLMSRVWEKELTPGQQRVLLVLCDHANDQGTNCYPSIGYIAWKIGISNKTVTEMISQLEKLGAIQVKRTAGKSSRYRIRIDNLTDKQAFKGEKIEEEWPDDPPQNVMGAESDPPQNVMGLSENVGTPPTKGNGTPHKTTHEPSVNHQSNRELETSDTGSSSDDGYAGLDSLRSSYQKKKTKKSATPQPPAKAKDDRRVWAMVDSYFDARGLEGHRMPESQRHAAYNLFAELPLDFGAVAVYGCASYLASQQFWQEPGRLTAKAVCNAIFEWEQKGRPTAEAPRTGQAPALVFANRFQAISDNLKEHGL